MSDGVSFRRPDRRQLLLGGALLAAAIAASALRPRSVGQALSEDALEQAVPRRIGAYRYASSTGLIVPEQEEIPGGMRGQLITRVYVADGLPPLMLLIAHDSAQSADLALHRPEACYPSAGYRILGSTPVPLSDVPGREAVAMTVARGDQVEQLYTWMRIGTRFPISAFDEKLAVLGANMRGALPDGVLVRLSIRSTDRAAALAQMTAFNRTLLSAMGGPGRALLLGEGVTA